MQRLLMLALCVCGCSLAGLKLSDRLKRRAAALADMRNGILALTGAVEHSNRPLARISRDIAARGGSSFWLQFARRLEEGEDAEGAWTHALNDASQRGMPLSALSPHDQALLKAFGCTLGKSFRSAQAESGRLTAQELAAQLVGADAQYAKKGGVYRALGVFMGLGLGILLW